MPAKTADEQTNQINTQFVYKICSAIEKKIVSKRRIGGESVQFSHINECYIVF